MKISFNRKIRRSPWGGGAHFASSFADYLVTLGHEVHHSLVPGLDWIVMLDPRDEEGGYDVDAIHRYKMSFPKVKVLHRINDTGKTRGGDQLDWLILNANLAVADHTVFISDWVKQYYTRVFEAHHSRFWNGEWSKRNHRVIHNGCDSRYFYDLAEPKMRGEKISLVTHHWSSNVAKGLDLYAHIDELISRGANYTLTYVGRYPSEYVPKNTKIIQPLYGKDLGDEIRKHDVYVTAARWEACGSHHVEAAACGLPIVYHAEGGGVAEMCSRYGVGIDKVQDFSSALHKLTKDYDIYYNMLKDHDFSAHAMCDKYHQIMKASQ